MAHEFDNPIEADADQSARITPAPSDNTTLTSIIEGLTVEGFAAELSARPDGQMHCGACGVISLASDYDVHSIRRLEGASDPDDMVAVVAAACPRCGACGVSVLAFGPTGSATDADVMAALDLTHRAAQHHRQNESPGERSD